jgi:hypothetical protein
MLHLADPSLFMFAEGAGGMQVAGITGNPHRVMFIAIAYDDTAQVVARLHTIGC